MGPSGVEGDVGTSMGMSEGCSASELVLTVSSVGVDEEARDFKLLVVGGR